ncbi:two-component system, chemotaxis family, response regulator CheY [Thermosulfidibacter takaii ABI70S6]|uniref:Two-component system, chemotaxis family, response regulator CheY n=1 Tax=Thermosulfidibacter takaii (strain DSM 17441 / JCM 13301 / NBRC 103674 / ABI70S6) TaxID=1298851 RepID=A0A0S3QTH0_THET7|nr:chemotaxis response regulator CheY [Thermosulfidibacter takaii]BAT71624.1 two-component system, chemotaxis family, response regulator CheY [Thermosulfidibacter takaii ABI70S6]
MKILVVDDSSTMRRIIVNTLRKLGYTDVIEAEHGLDALAKLKENPDVNLILTDWNMPEMDGLTFVQTLRRSKTFSKVPIIMITTMGAKEDIVKALKAGVNNYIVKPFTPQILKEKIEQTVKKLGMGS